MGAREYWCYDDSTQERVLRLAGDRLEGRAYQPLEVTEVLQEVLQGYSAALNVMLGWDHGE